MSDELALVRVAASQRRFLLSGWLFVVYALFAAVYQWVAGWVELPWLAVIGCSGLYWWYNRSRAVWIERDQSGPRVRTRRWARWEDLSTGRLRSDGTLLYEYDPTVFVSYNPDRQAWWRSDRQLSVGTETYAIYPESRSLAEALSDPRGWQQASDHLESSSLEDVVE